MVEVVVAAHLTLIGPYGKIDLAVGRAVDLPGIERLEESDRLGDPGLKLIEGGLVVLELRRLDAGEPRRAVLGLVGRDLDLAGEREHVGREPRVEQHRGIDLLGGGEGRALVEIGRERVKTDFENRQRGSRHRERHGMTPWVGEVRAAA